MGVLDCVDVAQDRETWRAIVTAVMTIKLKYRQVVKYTTN